ncbi:MAG: toll/interleukin-1 receptor domain-containing protein [Planctomycetota bacterium]|nr:toll/interleukin-1 receptor domain-containing protein [Planctomycetota bacterium]
MKVQTTPYDVFLSYSLPETQTADLVERALEGAGLNVFSPSKLEHETPYKDTIQLAIAESQIMVVVVDSRQAPSSNTMVELGAALAWDKPIYVVTEPGNTNLPNYLQDYPAFPVSRMDDLVQSARRNTAKGLSDDDRSILCDIYSELGIPRDKLIMTPAGLKKLAITFSDRSHTRVSQEQLAREILLLSKRGKFPRIRG